jgi:phospholipase C
MVRPKVLLVWGLLVCMAGVLIGCGGGGNATQSQPTITSVDVSCSPSSIPPSQTSKCSATVIGTGNFSSSVTWSVDNGSIDQSGNYSAPANATDATVKATSGQDATKSGSASVAVTPIQHVVVIFQENRTPDNLFQDPKLIAAGADIHNSGMNSKGQNITLVPVPLGCPPDNCQTYDPDHSHKSFVAMYDGGKMDGADKIPSTCKNTGTYCLSGAGNYSFAYVNPAEVQPYFTLAETYTFADKMFQTNQGPSFPAHQYLISGSSALAPPGMPNSNLFLAENPLKIPTGVSDENTGCTAPSSELVRVIDSATGDESQKFYPCFDRPTLTDQLNSKSISWKYYAPSAGSIWTAPNAISHMCVPNAPPPNATACTGSDWTKHVILNSTQVLKDISSNQLPTVSWVIPSGGPSDHPVLSDGSGPSWVASVVNAIGNSPYWANTAIFITWDDWGGWFDHVKPPAIFNSYEMGFRVPLIVVSPYAKPAHISHTVYDFGSILKFVEKTLALSTVAPAATIPYADTFSQTGDLSDCFDFNQTPLTFQTIPAKFDAAHFLNDKRAPTDPDDD